MVFRNAPSVVCPLPSLILLPNSMGCPVSFGHYSDLATQGLPNFPSSICQHRQYHLPVGIIRFQNALLSHIPHTNQFVYDAIEILRPKCQCLAELQRTSPRLTDIRSLLNSDRCPSPKSFPRTSGHLEVQNRARFCQRQCITPPPLPPPG